MADGGHARRICSALTKFTRDCIIKKFEGLCRLLSLWMASQWREPLPRMAPFLEHLHAANSCSEAHETKTADFACSSIFSQNVVD